MRRRTAPFQAAEARRLGGLRRRREATLRGDYELEGFLIGCDLEQTLWALEVHPPFIAHLRDSIDDPRFTLIPESAEAVATVRERQVEPGFDAIVSSIPFSVFTAGQTTEILRAAARSLRPDGVFVALQYHPRYLAPFLRAEFSGVEREVYLWNTPPATLLHARGPRRAD